MLLTIKTAKIVGDLEGQRWSSVVAEGNIMVLLEIAPTNSQGESQGKFLLDEILIYLEENPIDSLASLQKVLSLYKKRQEIITLTIGKVDENVLYLGIIGQGIGFIKRDEQVIKIIDGEENISGFLKKGDTLFLSTKSFSDAVSFDKQIEILKSVSFTEIAEVLAPLVLEKKDSSGCAALAAEITQDIKPAFPMTEVNEEESSAPLAEIPQNHLANIKRRFTTLFKKPIVNQAEPFYEDKEELKSKKTLVTVALILVALLSVSIFLGVGSRNSQGKSAEFTKNIDLVNHQLDEAGSLVDLNPSRARDLLSQAKTTLTTLQKQFGKNTNESKTIQNLLTKVTEAETTASKIYRLTNVTPFFDIALLRAQSSGSQMALYGGQIVILDSQNGIVYKLSADTKQSDILAGRNDIKEAKFIAIHGGNAFVLNADGIVSIDISGKTSKVIIKKDDAWGEIAGLVNFAANLYLLDKTHNQIWKYIATDAGFTERKNYLNSDVKLDFSKTKSISIDGSVWVLSGNDILKFTQGRPDQFNIKGLVGNIIQASQIYTDDTAKNIYLLDQGSGSIIVFDKEGTYQSAYQWDGFKQAASLVVSEDKKKIFVLSGSKIYAVDLKL